MTEPPRPHTPRALGALAASHASVPAGARVQSVADQFFAHPDLDAVALLDDGDRPVGLLTRGRLLLTLARGFGHELYARKPVSRIADPAPLVLPASMALDEALSIALERDPAALYDDIVVRNASGTYGGLVPVRELVVEQRVDHARRIAEHEAAVARAADLEKLDRLRAEFLAHAAHELRSPVSAMTMVAETIRLAAERGDVPGVHQRIALLLRNASRLRETVDDILDLSKLEAGKVEVVRRRFLVSPLLDELATTARLLLGAKPVAVRIEAPAGLSIDTDRAKLERALLNLVSNAAKFTDEGEVILAASAEAELLRIEVRDTGPGIGDEDLGRLFVPFGQVETASRAGQNGTGLGLVIARSLVQLLGGAIEVRSRRGAGTTFAVRLPHGARRSHAA